MYFNSHFIIFFYTRYKRKIDVPNPSIYSLLKLINTQEQSNQKCIYIYTHTEENKAMQLLDFFFLVDNLMVRVW